MRNKNKVIIYIILVIMSFIMLVPFAWMVLTAFKTVGESTQMDPFVIFPSHWRVDNFVKVVHNVNFGRLYFNTIAMIAFYPWSILAVGGFLYTFSLKVEI